MHKLFGFLAAGALALAASTSHAAPVTGVIRLTVAIDIEGVDPITISSEGTVDVGVNQIMVPAGAVHLDGTIAIPVTASTLVNMITATRISNLSGYFSPGGVTAQNSAEVCPPGGPGAAEACNAGGGLGGVMGLTGTINIFALGLTQPIEVDLNDLRVGQGGEGGAGPLIGAEAALFSTLTGLVNTGILTASTKGGEESTANGAAGMTLVSPTYVDALNFPLPTSTRINIPVPEAGTLLLIGSGMLGLALFGGRRD